MGIFAVKGLKRGDIILVERPILKTNSSSLAQDVSSLDEQTKQIYMDLYAAEDGNINKIEGIRRANR